MAKLGFKLTENSDGSYSFEGNVKVPRFLIKDGKLRIRFKKVAGDFICKKRDLVSLYGAPEEVGDNFDCSCNKLTSLEHCPRKVGGEEHLEKLE